jgi:hypothetical protein
MVDFGAAMTKLSLGPRFRALDDRKRRQADSTVQTGYIGDKTDRPP